MSRKMKWIVIASLACNVLFVGACLGMAIRHMGGPPPERVMAVLNDAQMPQEQRAVFQKRLIEQRESDKRMREESRKVREEAQRLLEAEPFDANAFRMAVSKMFAMRNQQRVLLANLVVEMAQAMNAHDRARLADALDKR